MCILLRSRLIVMFPVVPILTYATIRNEPDVMQRFLTGTMLPWVALIAFSLFISHRVIARRYERLLRELDDIERHPPLERYMATHEQWKEQGD